MIVLKIFIGFLAITIATPIMILAIVGLVDFVSACWSFAFDFIKMMIQ